MNFEYLPFKSALNNDLIAGFTLKNPSHSLMSARINGLNVGLNQLEDQNIVHKNRKLFFISLGITVDKVSSASQIHSNNIAYVDQPGIIVPNVDGLYTDKKGICLLIQVADCAPILLCDNKKGIIAAVHAGWRGAASGILINMIQKMSDLGANCNDIQMAIGPCIGDSSFEIGAEVSQVFPKIYSRVQPNRKYLLDLKTFLKDQAIEKGLLANNIQVSDKCSVKDVDNCYSHRREGSYAGRMGGFIYQNETQ